MTDIKITVINNLEQEIQWLRELNKLLSDEKQSLINLQFNLLEELANKKLELSLKIEQSAEQRMQIMNISKLENVSLSFNEFLKNCSVNDSNIIKKLTDQLMIELTLCRELNTVNGQVIASNIHTRQQIVDVLSGNKNDALNVYNANGNIKATPDANHHQEA